MSATMSHTPWDDHAALLNNGPANTYGSASTLDNRTCIEWVDNSLAECVQNWWGVLGVFIGYSSIGFWLFAQAPQLYLNFKNKNADSLSLPFLLAWLIGDSTNLIGSILAKQLPSQIYTSVYFCCVDVLLFSQYIMYGLVLPKMRRRDKRRKSSSKQKGTHIVILPAVALVAVGGVTMFASGPLSQVSPVGSGRILYDQSIDHKAGQPFNQGTAHSAGYAIGIVSAVFYLFSRVPQILKNYQRQSTGGLSFLMFVMAILGNLTYAFGVLLAAGQPYLYDSSDPPSRITMSSFMLDKTPWLVGSLGTLFFDLTIFFQFWYYGDKAISTVEFSGGIVETQPLLTGDDSGGNITPPDSDDSFEDDPEARSNRPQTFSPLFFPGSKKSSSYQKLVGSHLKHK